MAYYDSRSYYPHDRYDRSYPDYGDYGDSVEEVPRAYPPGTRRYEYDDYGYPPARQPRMSAVQGGHRRSRSYESDYSPRHRHRRSKYDDRPRHHRRPSPSPSPSPPRRRRSVHGSRSSPSRSSRHQDRRLGYSRSDRRRSYSGSPSPTRERGRHSRGKTEGQIAQAAQAAVIAGAVEAFRARKEPGDWKGDKGRRILTAAVSAGGTDGLMDNNPKKHGTRHLIESTLAGLATNHLVNGSRSQSRHRGGKRPSSSHGGVKDIASAGVLAAAGKEAYDRFQSRSQSRPRGRTSPRDSDDDSPHRGSRRRSKSVSDYINRGLAALGLEDNDKSRNKRSGRSDHSSEDDSYGDDSPPRHRRTRGGRDSRDVGGLRPLSDAPVPTKSGAGEGEEGRTIDSNSSSDSDLGDSSDEKSRRKKQTRKTILASGLATVATVHAAHSIYAGMEKRKKRRSMLEEGEITPEEARRRRIRANLGDAASVGIAAVGLKSAFSEWKEVAEARKESNNLERELRDRRARRERHRARSHGATPRLPYEIEDPEERSRSAYSLRSGSPPRRIPYY